jgi:hypothetical protein
MPAKNDLDKTTLSPTQPSKNSCNSSRKGTFFAKFSDAKKDGQTSKLLEAAIEQCNQDNGWLNAHFSKSRP